ncbi:hypothetical protein F5Y14DRAFT_418631 [Nemania sp. NC0429]|nr:hypothetical protein F5Y14DRAFT_418631 [Nemania sp. NC0429]
MMELIVKQVTPKIYHLGCRAIKWALKKRNAVLLERALDDQLHKFDPEEAMDEGLMSTLQLTHLVKYQAMLVKVRRDFLGKDEQEEVGMNSPSTMRGDNVSDDGYGSNSSWTDTEWEGGSQGGECSQNGECSKSSQA